MNAGHLVLIALSALLGLSALAVTVTLAVTYIRACRQPEHEEG
jgi:hypothetical protein